MAEIDRLLQQRLVAGFSRAADAMKAFGVTAASVAAGFQRAAMDVSEDKCGTADRIAAAAIEKARLKGR